MFGRSIAFIARNPVGMTAAVVIAGAWGAIAANALWMQTGPHPAPYFSRDTVASIPAVMPVPKPERRVSEIDPGSAADAERERAAERAAAVTRDLQGELRRRNFYHGPVDGRFGPQTEAAILAYEEAAGLAPSGEPSDGLLAHVRLSALSLPPVPQPSPLREASAQETTSQPAADVATGSVQPAADPVADLLARTPTPEQTTASVPAPAPQPAPVVAAAPSPAPVPAPAAAPATDPRIEAVQAILADLGYGPGSIDGRLSSETRRAIEDFEVDRGLPMTGRISPRLLEELSAVSGVPLG